MSMDAQARAGEVDLRTRQVVQGISSTPTRVVDGDGRAWSLPISGETAGVHGLLTFALGRMLSGNEREGARANTNESTQSHLRAYMRWAIEHGHHSFDTATLKAYRQHAFATRKAYGAWVNYAGILRAAKILIDAGKLPPFPLPRNENQDHALSEGKGGTTLTDLAEVEPGEDRDEELLGSLLELAWEGIEDRLSKLRQGAAWRAEVMRSGYEIPWEAVMRPLSATPLDKGQLIEVAAKICWSSFGGQIPPGVTDVGLHKDEKLGFPFRALNRVLTATSGKGRRNVTRAELVSYLHPGRDLVALSAIVFAAAQVNVDSIAHLTVDMLRADTAQPGRYRVLVWDKPRAGGDQLMPPFPVGGRDARSLPRLWERLLEATAHLRTQAPPGSAERLLLYMGWESATKRDAPMVVHPVGSLSLLFGTTFPKVIASLASQAPAGSARDSVAQIAPALTLSTVRTTAINVASKRLNRDFSKTAATGGHRSTRSLGTSYLNNRRVQRALDEQIEAGQRHMLRWARQPMEVVPDDPEAIEDRLGLDARAAARLRADALNLGTGVSLVDDRAIVIDTPLNALRMIQWLRRMREAEGTMVRENPERWTAIYLPQIALFEQALNDFPRRTLMAAKEMDGKYALPFPPVM